MLGVTSVSPAVSDASGRPAGDPTTGETGDPGSGETGDPGSEPRPTDPTAPAANWPPPSPVAQSTARAGELDVLWRTVLAACWIGVFFAFAAVWKASEEIGIATWWLGPRSDPQPPLIRLSPFILALAVGLIVISNRREAVWVSYGGAVVIGVLAALDVSRSGGLALVEFAIAGAVLLVTTASFAGRYRLATLPAAADDTVQPNVE